MPRHPLLATAASLLVVVFCAPAFAAEKHLLVGKWSVDVANLSQPNPPKSVEILLEEVGDNTYKMRVTIESHDGEKSIAQGTFQPDGRASKAEGSLDVDIAAVTMPSNRILVMGAGMAGNPASSRVFSLSDDGRFMIETIVRHHADGTPYLLTNTWRRQ